MGVLQLRGWHLFCLFSIYAGVVVVMGDLSKNFSRRELACPCGCGFGLGRNDIHHDLVALLQKIRDFYGKPIIVTSGCRCNTYNKKIGGAERSTHTFGMAADIQPVDGDREGLIRAIEHLYQSGKLKELGGFGYKTYSNGCIHVDVFRVADGHLRRW